MKKLVAIGDIHGRDVWKKIVEVNKDADRIIFIGDYFDAPSYRRKLGSNGEEELKNFSEIFQFKLDNPEQVVLLLGNHDYHYLPGVQDGCVGFQDSMREHFQQALSYAIEDQAVQWIHEEDEFLFSHAGVTKTWFELSKVGSVAEINDLGIRYFDFNPGPLMNGYGDEICQTPIWVRPPSLRQDKLDGYIHVVGHTPQPDGIQMDDGICFIDCLDIGQYLMILDGIPQGVGVIS